jgi:signal peptidase II
VIGIQRLSTAFCIGFLILLADIGSKFFTQHYLPLASYQAFWYPYGGIGVFKDFIGIEFSIIHTINRGAAWGILADWQDYLLYVRVALIVGLLLYVLFINKKSSWNLPFAFIIAGAIGNVIDYFLYGHVIDMFHFVFWGYDYPTFNLADSAIFMGIAQLFYLSWRESPTSKKQKI